MIWLLLIGIKKNSFLLPDYYDCMEYIDDIRSINIFETAIKFQLHLYKFAV